MGLLDGMAQQQIQAGEELIIAQLRAKGLIPEEEKKWEEMNSEEKYKLKMEQASKTTAPRYNRGKAQWSLVDFKALEPMVKVLEFGAQKYARDLWKKGLSKREILESALRHIFAMLEGEENDIDSSLPHIGHLLCNALFYSYFTQVDSTNARD